MNKDNIKNIIITLLSLVVLIGVYYLNITKSQKEEKNQLANSAIVDQKDIKKSEPISGINGEDIFKLKQILAKENSVSIADINFRIDKISNDGYSLTASFSICANDPEGCGGAMIIASKRLGEWKYFIRQENSDGDRELFKSAGISDEFLPSI